VCWSCGFSKLALQRPEVVRFFSQRREVHAGDDRLLARIAGGLGDQMLIGSRVDHAPRAVLDRLLIQAQRLFGFAETGVLFQRSGDHWRCVEWPVLLLLSGDSLAVETPAGTLLEAGSPPTEPPCLDDM
jgi:hypothetical protein